MVRAAEETLSAQDYLIEHTDIDWSTMLSPWHWLLPSELTVWLMNRFGDLFIVLNDGSVHMFDVGCGTLEQVAESRDAFREAIDQDNNADDWLMIPLIDRLVAEGKKLKPGYCYGYLLSPVFGGDYTVANTIIIPIHEHYGLNASLHKQIKDLPDGTAVRIKIEKPPGESEA